MPRGSAPGERRGGREKGVPNKATAAIKQLAGKYTKEAIDMLADIARKGESEAARVAAIKELLDRGHGRPPQSHEHSGSEDGPPIRHRVEQVIVDPSGGSEGV